MTVVDGERPVASPVAEAERIELIDILRGFALLGILAVNMAVFSHPLLVSGIGLPRGNGPFDDFADFVVAWLATGKFYPLFSVLFGLGVSIQLARAAAHGLDFKRYFVRRMLILLGIGVAHALLVWNGDILVVYALIGLLLFLFRNARPRTLLIWAAALFAIPLALGLSNAFIGILAAMAMGPALSAFNIAATLGEINRLAIETYARGAWGQIFIWRAVEWLVMMLSSLLNAGPHILGLFVLGMYAGKLRLFSDLAAHQTLFRKCLLYGMLVGLPANLLIALARSSVNGNPFSPLLLLSQPMLLVAGPLLTAGYVGAFAMLARYPSFHRILWPLAAAGRMALSNYLMQSIVCTGIFYSYGLGLYGQVGAFAGLALTFGLWIVQLIVSPLWLRAFKFGPMEWLWRSLTYGRRQPMRRSAPMS
ncbi:MAG TPA: DUF418 domain-containing protein [Thermoflexales bacterium]|nr:DUF418 domain-containing protein [Thermoflexales bacterium]